MQIQAVRGLVPCKISSHNAGLVQDKHGLVQDKQSGGWSRARQAVRGLVSCKTSSEGAGLVQDKQSGVWSRADTSS